MEQDHEEKVEKLEQEAKYKIIQMEDEIESSEILDDTKEELTGLYHDVRVWLKDHVDGDDIALRLEKLKQDTASLLEAGKIKTMQFGKRDDVQRAKNTVQQAGEKVMDHVSEGVHVIMENEYVEKAVDSVNEVISSVAQDERIKSGVKKMKKGTLKVAESAFQGLKKVLDTDEDHDEVKKG